MDKQATCSINALKEAYLYKEHEIDKISKGFKLKNIKGPIKLIYGRPDTGKTSILKYLLKNSRRNSIIQVLGIYI